nr:MAG TPA: hypothetical protein [Caudoviricetes sp.]
MHSGGSGALFAYCKQVLYRHDSDTMTFGFCSFLLFCTVSICLLKALIFQRF